jgi:hypothetical protein
MLGVGTSATGALCSGAAYDGVMATRADRLTRVVLTAGGAAMDDL